MQTHDLYHVPDLYDLEYADHVEDVAWYVRHATASGGPVLELGCGTGRLTLPLARAGVQVVGVDRAAPMLARLQSALADEPPEVRERVRAVPGDFTHLATEALGEGRFPLVLLPFNALHHCAHHRDVLALLAGVERALAPGGRFLLDCYLPDLTMYSRDPDDLGEERIFIEPGSRRPLRSWERGWYEPLTQVHHVVYRYRLGDDDPYEVRLDLRMFYPQELLALLEWGGFTVRAAYADFRESPVQSDALKWVGVLERS